MDYSVTAFLNAFAQSPAQREATIFVAQYLPYLIAGLFIVAVILLIREQRERMTLFLEGITAVFFSRAIFVELIRFFYHRPRPFYEDHAIIALLNETSYSFPSGHAAFFFALSTTVYLYNKRWGVSFFIASAVISIARVMAGVHYPTDILGGAALGIAVGVVVHHCMRRYRDQA